jgi:hypothetical protein
MLSGFLFFRSEVGSKVLIEEINGFIDNRYRTFILQGGKNFILKLVALSCIAPISQRSLHKALVFPKGDDSTALPQGSQKKEQEKDFGESLAQLIGAEIESSKEKHGMTISALKHEVNRSQTDEHEQQDNTE